MYTETLIDSGNGYFYSAIPSQKKNYKQEIGKIVDSHFTYKNDFELLMTSPMFRFSVLRLSVVYKYGLVQGRELIKMICRCAFNDSTLTDKESVAIMETCLDPALDNILLEVNYNEGWR